MVDLEANKDTEDFNFIPREIKTNMVRVLKDGIDTEITYKEFQKEHGAFGIIRISSKEFEYIENQDIKELTHFNLQVSSHKKKELYLLVKIIEHGNLDNKTQKETLPLLDISNPQLFRCIECDENVTYKNLSDSIFENSFPNIKSIEQLRKEIVNRYSKSMQYLTSEEILELGLSITKLIRVNHEEIKKNRW
jgi:hypothetical protein